MGTIETAFPKIVGDSALEGLASRLAIRATKAAVHGSEALARAGNQTGYGLVDLGDPSLRGDGWRTMALVPAAYKESPELFYGPFLQVGSYLRESGIIEDDAAAFAIDMVVDPLNLVSAGTLGVAGKMTGGLVSGLTKTGRWGRLMSMFGEGGKVTSGAVIFDKMVTTLETAGKLAGKGDELLTAAKAGDKSQLKRLIKETLATGTLSPEDAAMLKELKADRDILVDVFSKSEDMKKLTLGEGDFLQKTIRSRLEAGQINPLFKIAKPEWKNPLRFTTQLIGFEHSGEKFFFPMSRSMASGLDAIGKGTLAKSASTRGVPEIVTGLDLAEQAKLGQAINKDFASAGFKSGDLHGWQVAANMKAFDVIVGAPSEQQLADIAELLGDPDALKKELELRYRTARPRVGAKGKIDPSDFQQFTSDLMQNVAESRSDIDKRLIAARDSYIARSMGEARSALDQAIQSEEIKEATAATYESQLRRLVDVFSTRMLTWEATNPGNALAARRAIGRVMARNVNAGIRDIIRRDYSGRKARSAIAEVFGSYMSHPTLFTKQGSNYVLSASMDEIAKESPFLADTIRRQNVRFGSGEFERLLREKGLSADVSLIADSGKSLLHNIGSNFVEYEGILDRLVSDYFPRIFRPNAKFYAYAKAHGMDVSWMAQRGVSQEAEGEIVERVMGQVRMREMRGKQAEGSLTFNEVRKFSEEKALEFEKMGFGRYEKDGVQLLAAYLDAANGAQLMTRLVRDMPRLSGKLTWSELVSRFGTKWLDQNGIKPADVEGVSRIMRSDKVPAKLKAVFDQLEAQERTGSLAEDVEGLVARGADVATSKLLARTIVPDARRAVADRMGGWHQIDDVRLFDKAGNEVMLDPTWITANSFPSWLRGRQVLTEKKLTKEFKAGVSGPQTEALRLKNVKAGASGEPPKAYRLLTPRQVRDLVNEHVNKEMVKISKTVQRGQAKLRQRGLQAAAQKGSVSVYRGDFGHLKEAFGLYKKTRDPNSAWDRFTEKFDEWNYRLKSVVLLGDIFHFNVLSFGQILSNPAAIGKNFVEDAAQLIRGREIRLRNTVVGSAVGAAGGAGIGVLEGSDMEATAAFAIVGGVYGLAITNALKNARAAARNFMNPESLDTLMRMGVGGWTGRPDDRSIGILNSGLRAMAERFARDPARQGLVHPIDGVAGVLDWWDDLLWTTLHNGSKHYYFSVSWGREFGRLKQRDAYKKADEAGRWLMEGDLSRQIMQSANTFFGGEAFRFLLDDPAYVQMMRRLFLSPDWTTSRLAVAADYFMNMGPVKAELMGAGLGTAIDYAQTGGDVNEMSLRGPVYGAGLGFAMRKWGANIQRRMTTKGDVMAKEARRMALAALAGGFTMAAALNLAFTGRPIWENPEGHRTHVQLPDGSFVSLGKAWVEPFEFAGVFHPDKYPIPLISRSVSKGAVLPVQGLHVLGNTSGFGGPLVTGKDGPFEMAYTGLDFTIDMGTPIIFQGPLRAATEALTGPVEGPAFARAGIRSLGFQISHRPMPPRTDLSVVARGSLSPPSPVAMPSLVGQQIYSR